MVSTRGSRPRGPVAARFLQLFERKLIVRRGGLTNRFVPAVGVLECVPGLWRKLRWLIS